MMTKHPSLIAPCPFCRRDKTKVEFKTRNTYGNRKYITCSVRCNACHARGSVASKTIQGRIFSGYDEELEIEAIKLWNRWEGAF